MTNLMQRPWFRPTVIGFLLVIQLTYLLLFAFLLPPISATGHSHYESLATLNVTSTADVLENCENYQSDPLYPLLLHGVLQLLPARAGLHAALLINLVLAAGLWLLLYGISRRLLHIQDAALLPPFLYFFSASAVSAFTNAIPSLLSAMLAAALAFYYLHHLRRPIKTVSGILLFLLVLAGTLTDYSFFFFALAISLPYGVISLMRRRVSDFVSSLVLSFAALLTAIVLYPAYINRTISLFEKEQFLAVSYIDRIRSLLEGLALRLFGYAKYAWIVVFLLLVLLIIAVVLQVMRPKKEASESEPEKAVDPAQAAYQRRIARRRTNAFPRKVTVTRAQVFSIVLFAACVLYTLLLPICTWAGEAFLLLDPFCILLLVCTLHFAIPAVGGNRKAFFLITIGVFLALTLLTFSNLVWQYPLPVLDRLV